MGKEKRGEYLEKKNMFFFAEEKKTVKEEGNMFFFAVKEKEGNIWTLEKENIFFC